MKAAMHTGGGLLWNVKILVLLSTKIFCASSDYNDGEDEDYDDDDGLITATLSTQVAFRTYQSQLRQSSAATTCQCQDQLMAQIGAVQDATHKTLHQLINRMNALAFNVSDAGR